ncbi:GNAT family N-acetyltransferase [Acidobacteriota bacterium]
MIHIRIEIPDDYEGIDEVNRQAFEQEVEGQLIRKIREGQNFIEELSLVALDEETIVGHILFSKIKIKGESEHDTLALAPMSVKPEYQQKGIGKKLVRAGLKKAKDLGFGSVIVLGHSDYYPQFGFQEAAQWKIKCPFDAPDESFMAIQLIPGDLEDKSGTVIYPKEFNEE